MAVGAAIGSVVGGLAQAGAARSAAKSQERAAGKQLDLQDRMFEQSREDLSPYRDSGTQANKLLEYYLGIRDEMPTVPGSGRTPEIREIRSGGGGIGSGRAHSKDTMRFSNRMSALLSFGRGDGFKAADQRWVPIVDGGGRTRYVRAGGGGSSTTRYEVDGRSFNTREEAEEYARSRTREARPMVGFQETPGYQFALDEGLSAVESGAAARGGLYSGATMQALQQRGNDLANLEFGNYLSRLEGQVTRGGNAAAQSATVNQNNAQMGSNALANMGNAQAAGAIGVGNAISDTINNGIGLWQYQNTLNQYPGAQTGATGFNPQSVRAPTPAWEGILGGY